MTVAELAAFCDHHAWDGRPEDLMISLCEGLLDEIGCTVPVNVEALASARGAVVRTNDKAHTGFLYPEDDRLVVVVPASDTPGRRRFTVCHEVCHTFFPDFREREGQREQSIGTFDPGEHVEYLCDLGAAELLLPRQSFAWLLREDFTLDDILELARIFEASVTATAVRCVDLSEGPAAVVVLEPDGQGLLAVRSARGSAMQVPAAGTAVPSTSLLYGALHKARIAFCGASGLLPGPHDVSAIALPYEREGKTVRRILALLRPAG